MTFFIVPGLAWGQSSVARRALKQLEDGKWLKAREILVEALRKDSINSGAKYGLSLIYTIDSLAIYNIDTAYQYIQSSLFDFSRTDSREKERLVKTGLDSLRLIIHKEKLDSLAFLRVKSQDLVESYDDFLKRFNTASQYDEAVKLRNQAAFLIVEKEATYQGYKRFLDTYPGADEKELALSQYEKLYYQSSTNEGNLESYLGFLKAHPSTPYRPQVEAQVLKLSTLDNEISSYEKFIEDFPKSAVKPKAVARMYHLFKEQFSSQIFDNQYANDSLSRVIALDSGQWIVHFDDEQTYIMNEYGEDVTPSNFPGKKQDAWCNTLVGDHLWWKGQDLTVIGRDGHLIWQGEADNVKDMGYGLLRITNEGLTGIVHKSGEMILPLRYREIAVVLGALLAVREEKDRGLVSFHGNILVPSRFDEIVELGSYLLLRKDEEWSVTNKASVISAIQGSLKMVEGVEDFELFKTGHLWIEAGGKEGMLGQDLTMVIPLKEHVIKPWKSQYIVQSPHGLLVYDPQQKQTIALKGENCQLNKQWAVLTKKEIRNLYLLDSVNFSQQFNKVELFGDHFAVGYRQDSSWLLFRNKGKIYLDKPEQLKLIRSSNSNQYMLMEEGNRKILYDQDGGEVLNTSQGAIAAVGKEYITLSVGGRKGLYSSKGERLLPIRFDAFGSYEQGEVSVLRRKKFGLFNAGAGINIPPVYDRRLTHYNPDILVAYQGQDYGLVDKRNKPLTKFEFSEIHFWNDSIARVRNNGRWGLYNFIRGDFAYQDIWTFADFQSGDETLAIFSNASGFGVIGNRRGLIVPPIFSEIKNIGTAAAPVFLAEKYLSELDYLVVAHYNSRGEVIKKQSFDPDLYEKISCKH